MATTDFVVKNGLVVNEDALIRDTTNSTSTTTGALVVSGGLGVASALYVGGTANLQSDLTLTGDLAVNGGDITTSQTTFNLVNATATTVNIAGAATDVQIGSATGTTEINNNLNVVGDVDIDGGDLTASTTSFNLINTTATTLNIGSAATTARLGATSGTLTLGNPTVVGTQVSQDLYNTLATTLNFGGAATALTIGATTGTATIRNASVILSGDLEVRGGDLTTNQTTFNLVNGTATTLNIGGAATAVDIGAASGTTSINNNLDVDLDVNIRGGDLTVSTTTFNLVNSTATTLNIGGAATTISLGASSGTTTVNNNMVVTGDLTVNGTTTTINSTTVSVDDINIVLGDTASPTDVTADGGGITLRGTTNKTFIWVDSTDSWTSNQNIAAPSYTLNAATGNFTFADSGTTRRGVYGSVGTNDQWFVGGGATATDGGFMEIATGDNATEPIYVRQYTGTPLSGTVTRELTLLDASGNTTAPGIFSSASIQNTPIGSTTRASGAFTTLAANNAVTFTQNTSSTSTTSGTLVVTGGVGISENLFVGGRSVTPRINIERVNNTNSGISWYNQASYTAWSDYMAQASQTSVGPTGNITAPSGTLVTSWGLRRFIENVAGYGWTWESGTSSGQPSVVAEIRSSDGAARFGGDVSGNTLTSRVATGTAPLTVASTTLVTNLNADLLDGLNSATANTASTIVARDASGNFSAGTITATLSGNSSTTSRVLSPDTRAVTTTPETLTAPGAIFDFKENASNALSDGGTYHGLMTYRPYGSSTDWTGGPSHQIGFTANGNLWHRSGTSTTWGTWRKIYEDDDAATANTASTLVLRDGSGNFSAGTITAALSGNATTASTWQTARTLTIGSTGKSVNGGANVSWSIAEIGAVQSSHYTGIAQPSTWSRIATTSVVSLGGTYLLSLNHTRNSVVVNATFLISVNHSLSRSIAQLSSGNYTQIQVRLTDVDANNVHIEIFDNGVNLDTLPSYSYDVRLSNLGAGTHTPITTFTAGAGTVSASITSEFGGYKGPTLRATSNTGSTSTTTGALVVTGGAGISENLYVGGTLQATNLAYTGTTTSSVSTISGAGSVQGDATAITTDLVVVSTVNVGTGVRLPAASAGKRIVVRNNGANDLRLYPATGAQINTLGTNAAFLIGTATTLEFIGFSSTQWYTVNATFA